MWVLFYSRFISDYNNQVKYSQKFLFYKIHHIGIIIGIGRYEKTYRYRPIIKMDLSVIIGGRYEKKLISRTLPCSLNAASFFSKMREWPLKIWFVLESVNNFKISLFAAGHWTCWEFNLFRELLGRLKSMKSETEMKWNKNSKRIWTESHSLFRNGSQEVFAWWNDLRLFFISYYFIVFPKCSMH